MTQTKTNYWDYEYSTEYWTIFALNILVVIISTVLPGIGILASLGLQIYLCVVTHRAFKLENKNYGWAVALLAFIPFGFWIIFFVVRSKLKKIEVKE